MVEWIEKFLISNEVNGELSFCISNAIAVVIIFLISAFAYLFAKKILLRVLKAFIVRSQGKWDDILLQNKVFDQMPLVIPAFVVHAFAPVFPSFQIWIQRIAFCCMVIVFLLVLDKFLDAVDAIYRKYEVSKTRPIKGYLQVLKIILYAVGIVVMISVLIDRSPLILLSGIGAATAVLLLVFQNSILGFVAGIQLTSNDMVRLGDWIEMPHYGADGDVIEISLHTVKVQNWDKTITTIPTHALVAESFINWRGMQESGGRRIKRAVNIDISSIKFCDEEMLERFSRIQYIRQYVEDKKRETESYNTIQAIDSSTMANGRHLTNIGTFRAYVESYLKNHPNVHSCMTRMVRQLDPTEKGLPIEIYVFINDTAWERYEAIQADLFDHILAVIPEFDLAVFQNPTGNDFKRITR